MTDHHETPESPHDVLAAEEFGMGTADPALHVEPPHDVLAAEEFELPAGDPALRSGAFDVPESPSAGGGPPREVLAADAFAVPAGRAAAGQDAHASAERSGRGRRLTLVAAAAALAGALVARRRG
jgi:hypothetical protein